MIMKISLLITLWLFITFLILTSMKNKSSDPSSSILHGKCNAKVNRDYHFIKKTWVGPDDKPSSTFITSLEKKSMILRNKIFANLNTESPVIKSISPSSEYFPEGEIHEFSGKVINRTDKMVVIKWENPWRNKVWTAAIHLEHKVAIVTEYYNGMTSFGVNVETLDCK
jgi:hypothetical protein